MDDDRDPSGCRCLGAACTAVRLYRRGGAGQDELFHLAIAARQGFDVRQTETPCGGNASFPRAIAARRDATTKQRKKTNDGSKRWTGGQSQANHKRSMKPPVIIAALKLASGGNQAARAVASAA